MNKMTLDTLAVMVQKGFLNMENKMVKQEDLLVLTERVGRLEERVEYGFAMVAQELKEIKNQMKEIDVGADVFQLRLRVEKIEKRLKER